MSDRYSSIVVALDSDVSEEKADTIMHAILQIKGVNSAGKNVTDIPLYVAESRVRNEYRRKFFEFLNSI